jgi:hypothetical protein
VTALMAVFVTGGCALSSEYTDGEGADSGPDVLDASVHGDAATHLDAATTAADAEPPPDSGADVDAGPFGDFCEGVPEITTPTEGGTVSATQQIAMSVPGCISNLAVYLDSNPDAAATASLDGGVDGSVTVDVTISIPTLGNHNLNVNAWNHTNTPHMSLHVGVTRTQ